jgi:hypothetical protein
MNSEDKNTEKENEPKKFVIEYDMPLKLALAENYKSDQDNLLQDVLSHFKTGDFKIVDTYIVYGTLKENDYYGKDEPQHSTVVIIESDIMHTIFPDYTDYIDQMFEESIRLLQENNLYIECHWKIIEMDIDVFVLSLKI